MKKSQGTCLMKQSLKVFVSNSFLRGTCLMQCLKEFHFLLNKMAMLFKERAEKETKVLYKVLFIISSGPICLFDVCAYR